MTAEELLDVCSLRQWERDQRSVPYLQRKLQSRIDERMHKWREFARQRKAQKAAPKQVTVQDFYYEAFGAISKNCPFPELL